MRRATIRLLAILLPLAAWADLEAQHRRHPPGGHAHRRAWESPDRERWQKPEEVLRLLQIKPEEVIADVGAGTGYFTRRFARLAAKIYAVDIDPECLQEIAAHGLPNVTSILAAPDDPKLAPASVDTIFFSNVLHHIDQRPAYYAKLKRALKPGGRVVIIDFHKRELPVGPPVSMKLAEEEVVAELEAAGFVREASYDLLPYQYFLVFRPR